METYCVPGINRSAAYGRWAFAEFTDVYTLQDDFSGTVGTMPQKRPHETIGGSLHTPVASARL